MKNEEKKTTQNLKLEILKKAMSEEYCYGTRFDYLDEDEIEMILNAMEEYKNLKNV